MPAIPQHNTEVVDRPWDGPAQEVKINTPVTGKVARLMWAWYDSSAPDGDNDGWPDVKYAYKFPHHEVDGDGNPGAANVNGVRTALARIPQADIPEADRDGVRKHLQHHLDAYNAANVGSDRAVETAPEALVPIVAGQPWALRREALPTVAQACRAAADKSSAWPAWSALSAIKPRAARSATGQRTGGMVAVLPLCGVLTPRGSFLSMLFGGGGGGLMDFRDCFREAVSNPDIGAIVIDIDSPGGLHTLVPETAAEIYAARGSKPIIAISDAQACSGAYWIGAQADEFVCTPSGTVGSIGSYILHEDWSGFNEQMGIDPTYIYAGRYKVDGNPDEPLSDTAREEFQNVVDACYAEFLDAVAQGRGVSVETVQADYGEGRSLMAPEALAAGMIDRVATLEAVVADLLGVGTASGGARTRVVAPSPRNEDQPASPEQDPAVPAEPAQHATEPTDPDSDLPDHEPGSDVVVDLDESDDDDGEDDSAALADLIVDLI